MKQWGIQPRNPTLQSKYLATYKIFTTQLLEGENPIMSKEIINFKLENIWTSLLQEWKLTKFMEYKYHKSYQSKLVCFLGQPNLCSSLSMEANHQWEQCTQDSSKDFDYQSQMAKNYNGPSKSKDKRARERMRAWAREWVWVCNPNEEGKPP